MKVRHPDLEVTGHAAHRARTRIRGIPKKKLTNFLYDRLRSEDTVYIKGSISNTDKKLRSKGTVEIKNATFSYHDNKFNVIYILQFSKTVVKLLTVKYPDGDPRYRIDSVTRVNKNKLK